MHPHMQKVKKFMCGIIIPYFANGTLPRLRATSGFVRLMPYRLYYKFSCKSTMFDITYGHACGYGGIRVCEIKHSED